MKVNHAIDEYEKYKIIYSPINTFIDEERGSLASILADLNMSKFNES
jgi:hypothetical protein